MTLGVPTHALPVEPLLPAVADADFDRLAALARRLMSAPVALVTLPNQQAQVFPGVSGVDPLLEITRTNGLEYSYCRYVVESAQPMIVPDTREVPGFSTSLSTTECGIRAYAGMPLRDENDQVVGSLCVLDLHPRQWETDELEILADLAAACSSQLKLNVINARTAVSADRDRIGRQLGDGVIRGMFGLSLQLGNLRSQVDAPTAAELTAAIGSIDTVIHQIRSSIYDVAT